MSSGITKSARGRKRKAPSRQQEKFKSETEAWQEEPTVATTLAGTRSTDESANKDTLGLLASRDALSSLTVQTGHEMATGSSANHDIINNNKVPSSYVTPSTASSAMSQQHASFFSDETPTAMTQQQQQQETTSDQRVPVGGRDSLFSLSSPQGGKLPIDIPADLAGVPWETIEQLMGTRNDLLRGVTANSRPTDAHGGTTEVALPPDDENRYGNVRSASGIQNVPTSSTTTIQQQHAEAVRHVGQGVARGETLRRPLSDLLDAPSSSSSRPEKMHKERVADHVAAAEYVGTSTATPRRLEASSTPSSGQLRKQRKLMPSLDELLEGQQAAVAAPHIPLNPKQLPSRLGLRRESSSSSESATHAPSGRKRGAKKTRSRK